jgi:GNAT superfamily N-acetyltransferase
LRVAERRLAFLASTGVGKTTVVRHLLADPRLAAHLIVDIDFFFPRDVPQDERETRAVRRNMPDPIPATLLARLALDQTEQGHGRGDDLLQEAMKRTLAGAKHSAARLLIVHALNSKASDFYNKHGFIPLKGETNALYMPLTTIVAAL